MKIVQIAPRYPPQTGGVETHVSEISERLVERRHDVAVLTADAGDDVPRWEKRNGVVVRRHRALAPGGAFHVAPGIAWSVRRMDADVVHAHNYHSLPMLFAALGTSSPLVVTPHYHGGSANDLRDHLLSLYRPFGGFALHRAKRLVAVSDWERNKLKEEFGRDAVVIPNGIDIGQFESAEPEKRDRPYLLCVGRLEEYKGVQHVIRALPRLPEYDLLIAGSGPYRSTLEQIAQREGVTDRVQFLGYVSDNRLPQLYAGATVYLSLSEFEAYGLTVAEALATRTPCVVRAVGALVDWVGNTGVVGIDTPRPEAVSQAVKDAREHEPTNDSVFDWDTVVERLEKIYQTT
ncbi:glycosyltransferase family 4 protein [Halomicrococcus sp. SG-WS-1]|uniref:glycosyltransferase family 4 protein n=1 Tax=Halomicrococcus sp. SG-WS-1 TaxID=3439057 RepID=UPI003F7A853C